MSLIVKSKPYTMRHVAFLAACLFLLTTEGAMAKVVRAKIEHVYHDMIYLSSGDVVFTNIADKSWSGVEGAFHLDSDHNLISVKSLKSKEIPSLQKVSRSKYSPSIVGDMHTLHRLYSRMRDNYQESAQCFNMAHVWAYEEFKRTGLKSMKMFLFFTQKYIKRYRFKWWFHVSPMVLLKADKQSQMMILDRRYTLGPFDIKSWTDHFMVNLKSCKQVSKFYEYYNHQQSQDCYLIPKNMYYWQPRSIRLGDQQTGELSSFRSDEVRAAMHGF